MSEEVDPFDQPVQPGDMAAIAEPWLEFLQAKSVKYEEGARGRRGGQARIAPDFVLAQDLQCVRSYGLVEKLVGALGDINDFNRATQETRRILDRPPLRKTGFGGLQREEILREVPELLDEIEYVRNFTRTTALLEARLLAGTEVLNDFYKKLSAKGLLGLYEGAKSLGGAVPCRPERYVNDFRLYGSGLHTEQFTCSNNWVLSSGAILERTDSYRTNPYVAVTNAFRITILEIGRLLTDFRIEKTRYLNSRIEYLQSRVKDCNEVVKVIDDQDFS